MAFTKVFLSASILLVSLFASISNAAFAITGATGGVHPRLEIRQMFRDHPIQWNLYLQALRQFQGNQQTYITSWYQIAGIHGSPQIPWDGVASSGSGVGYCTHGINLFPCWHRPYLALFEQKLQQAAVYVANQYTGLIKQAYLDAANTMRTPYWDWAAAPLNGLPTLPLIVSQKYVTIHSPTGDQTIINPLFRYDFHPVQSDTFSPYGAPFNQWGVTLRYPTSTAAGASSQNNLAQSTLDNNRVSQRQSLYNWFTLCPQYDQISNDQPAGSSSSCHISLESLHNNIHVWVGGPNNGHMTIVPVSAFDPTFMLHHAMIDRLFALWQALYPNSYISNEASQIDTFTIATGSVQGPNSPLTPFHKDTAGNFWTCASSRQTETFNYVYPEFANSDGSSASIRGYVNRLYGPNASATAGSSKAKRDAEPEAAPEPGLVGDVLNGVADLPSAVTTANNGSTYQYIANIQTTRYKLDGSYIVYMFFGQPQSEDPTAWGTMSNMVGSYGVFSSPGMTGSDAVTTSTVPLTDALANTVSAKTKLVGPILATLTQPLVTSFLQKNLFWRVAKSDGTIVDPDDIPDFKVSVVSSTMAQPASENAFPTWSEFSTLTEITRGKKGGVSQVSELHLLGKRDHLYVGVTDPEALHE